MFLRSNHQPEQSRRTQAATSGRPRATRALALTAAMLIAFAAPQPAAGQCSAGTEWTTPNGTLQGTRYSSLTQINAGKATSLIRENWSNSGIGGKGSTEGQPLVVSNRMYVVTPFPQQAHRLRSAAPGRETVDLRTGAARVRERRGLL